MLAPVEAHPAHVGLDRLDVLVLLLDRVGVVEAQVAAPAELGGDAEVEADRLCMADVQVAVGLGREACNEGLGAPGGQVRADDLADEVAARPLGCYSGIGLAHGCSRSGPGLGGKTPKAGRPGTRALSSTSRPGCHGPAAERRGGCGEGADELDKWSDKPMHSEIMLYFNML